MSEIKIYVGISPNKYNIFHVNTETNNTNDNDEKNNNILVDSANGIIPSCNREPFCCSSDYEIIKNNIKDAFAHLSKEFFIKESIINTKIRVHKMEFAKNPLRRNTVQILIAMRDAINKSIKNNES